MSMTPRRRREDRLPHRLWAWLRRVLMMIGIMVMISVVMLSISLSQLSSIGRVDMRDKMVLAYVIDEELAEVAEPASIFNPRLIGGDTLRDVVEALTLAAGDARVAGVLVRLDNLSLSLAQTQEMRAAVLRLRAAGKFAWIYANDYGAAGSGGMAPYYLASAFGDIWLQPVGGAALPGLAFQVPFMRDLLARFNVEADMIQKGRYKSAPESLTAQSMSDAARANLEAVLQNLSTQVRDDIALSRNLEPSMIDAALARGLFTGAAAVENKLVDRIGYVDELIAAARSTAGMTDLPEDDFLTPLLGYADVRRDEVAPKDNGDSFFARFSGDDAEKENSAPKKPKTKIAVITAAGQIVDDRANPGMSSALLTPNAMREAFADVRDDDGVAAIVLRLDTPGGSAFASESIRRLVQRAQARGTPVVVSMGSVAASGGYWIASAANHIVADPATLTGSIGVFGGKVVIGAALENWGVSVETLKSAPGADIWSALRPFSDGERATIDTMMQGTYDAFIARVAEGRKMDANAVEELAGGQVFSGQQAKQLGLVDTLGGFETAVLEAKRLGGIAADVQPEVIDYPGSKGPLEQIVAILTGEVSLPRLRVDDLLQTQHPALLAPVTGVR